MSAEEDTELRDLVAQTLESKGVLGKIRAQLRASVFLALEEQEGAEGKMPLVNPGLKTFLSTSEGRLVTGLVREFLEYFDLDFSIAVFDPETNFRDKYPGRNNLARELQLNDAESSSNSPLLAEVIKHLSPNTPSEKPAKETIVVSPRHSATGSPRSTSPPSLHKVDADDVGDLSSDIDSNDSMPSSPRPSKIPQRVKDDRSAKSEKSLSQDSFLDRLSSNKEFSSRSDPQRDGTGKRSPDVTIGSDDEDIFADFPPKTKIDDVTSRTLRESDKKGTTNEQASKTVGGLSSLKGAPSLGSSTLGSLKGAPPLPGINNNRDVSNSPNWKDLAEIDNRINKLGFDVPGEDRNAESPDFNDDYEDDFIATSEHSMSIPEDIDEQLSLSSFHSGSAKLDDLLTTDRTVSQASVGDLDFAEDVLKF